MVKCKGESERIQGDKKIFNGVGFHGGINCAIAPFKIERKSQSEFNHEECIF